VSTNPRGTGSVPRILHRRAPSCRSRERPSRNAEVLSGVYCSPRTSDASDAIPFRGSRLLPCALARSRRGAPSNRPHGQLARASGATLPRRRFAHPETRASSPPFERLRHPRHRPVIYGGGQPPSSASRSRLPPPRKAACHRVPSPADVFPAGAFHTAQTSHRRVDEGPSNAILTFRP
jgi:hypothetical protein